MRTGKPAGLWAGLALALCTAAFAGCATNPQKEPAPAAISEPMATTKPAPVAAAPKVSQEERFQNAVRLLEQGDADAADAELRAYLAVAPDSKPARYLLAEIETPLAALFPADHFTVTLGKEDTLSSLAATYLGNRLGFYGLARYNALALPAQLSAGRMILIPKTKSALAALSARIRAAEAKPVPKLRPATESSTSLQVDGPTPLLADPWPAIRSHVAAGRYDLAIRIAEANHVRADRAQGATLAAAYLGNARAVRAKDPALAAAQARKAGEIYLDPANLPEKAMDALGFALDANPGDGRAKDLLADAKNKTADLYYRKGLVAFRKQDLDGAIQAWDHALAVDPAHKNAQLNKEQALDLKRNLQKLR